MEQEIDLVLEKKGVFASALLSWGTKWVPAIKEYASTLSGKKAELVSEAQKACEGEVRLFLFPSLSLPSHFLSLFSVSKKTMFLVVQNLSLYIIQGVQRGVRTLGDGLNM